MPNPESKDPIYADLLNEQKVVEATIATTEKDLSDAEANLRTIEARDPGRKRAVRERDSLEKKLVILKERALYFEIRTEQRKKFVQKDYLAAFHAKKPWPRPEEFAAYQGTKKLVYSSRNWDDRVPKLTRHLKNPPAPVTKAEEPKKSGH